MRINQKGLQLIKDFEGCRLVVYADAAGYPTVGYGHMDFSLVLGNKITQAEAEELLRSDLQKFEDGVSELLVEEYTANQFSAMVSLAFNIGLGAFKKSTLLRKFNAGDILGAAAEFHKWNKAGGKVLKGLVRRRQAEARLFLEAA